MDKREMLHKILDQLLTVQESSSKVIFFDYSGHTDTLTISVAKNKLAYSNKLTRSYCITLDQEKFDLISHNIDVASLMPDGPIEKMIELTIEESKAKELGLIA